MWSHPRIFSVCRFVAVLLFSQSMSTLAAGQAQRVLHLSQTVPYRVFTLDDPRRLVADFKEIDWTGVKKAALDNADLASDLRFGTLRPGWSRLVVDLDGPLLLAEDRDQPLKFDADGVHPPSRALWG